MGILSFIKRISVQTAVYWEPTGNDGYGSMTWADPVEIPVRWDDVVEIGVFVPGTKEVPSAVVLLNQEINPQGYLYLGTLDDFEDMSNPVAIEKAYPIKKFTRTPLIRSNTDFVKIAYL